MTESNISPDVPTLELPFFQTPTEFSMYIENHAVQNEMTYLEAIMEYCEDHLIDPSDIATKITKSLKSKLEENYRELNYLPRMAQLDF